MPEHSSNTLRITCPCCEAILTVDPSLATVLRHELPARPHKVHELKDASRLLEEEASHRQEKYRNIMDAEKDKGKVLDRKFQELLKKAKEEPLKKPLKDIDLD